MKSTVKRTLLTKLGNLTWRACSDAVFVRSARRGEIYTLPGDEPVGGTASEWNCMGEQLERDGIDVVSFSRWLILIRWAGQEPLFSWQFCDSLLFAYKAYMAERCAEEGCPIQSLLVRDELAYLLDAAVYHFDLMRRRGDCKPTGPATKGMWCHLLNSGECPVDPVIGFLVARVLGHKRTLGILQARAIKLYARSSSFYEAALPEYFGVGFMPELFVDVGGLVEGRGPTSDILDLGERFIALGQADPAEARGELVGKKSSLTQWEILEPAEKEIRTLFCAVWNRIRHEQGKPTTDFGVVSLPTWDGGTTPFGRTYKPLWAKLLGVVRDNQFDPEHFFYWALLSSKTSFTAGPKDCCIPRVIALYKDTESKRAVEKAADKIRKAFCTFMRILPQYFEEFKARRRGLRETHDSAFRSFMREDTWYNDKLVNFLLLRLEGNREGMLDLYQPAYVIYQTRGWLYRHGVPELFEEGACGLLDHYNPGGIKCETRSQ